MTSESCTSPAASDAVASRMPFLQPPGAVLFWLGNSICALRTVATWTIAAETSGPDIRAWVLEFFRREWAALGEDGYGLVPFLADAMTREESLLAIEYMAHALAVQGRDGVAELRALTSHRDFHVRWKAALALTTIEAPEYNGHPTTTIPQDAQSNCATTALIPSQVQGIGLDDLARTGARAAAHSRADHDLLACPKGSASIEGSEIMNPPHASSPSHISEVRLRSDVARTIDGGGLLLALIHPSAPAVHVRKSRDSRKNLVPVLFAAVSLSSGADLHRMSDGMIMLIHNVAASDASTFLLAPFLFNRFGDPRRFCAVLSTALQSTSEHRDITWFIDHLHVTIIEGGISYEAIPVGDTLMASGTICR